MVVARRVIARMAAATSAEMKVVGTKGTIAVKATAKAVAATTNGHH
jgi:hypothetical protein